ncbi:MAG: hypothetical protein U1E14_02555 [Geminicoccaceae bacterium]
MTQPMRIARRTALLGAAGSVVVIASPLDAMATDQAAIRKLVGLLSDPAGAAQVGAVWLRGAAVSPAAILRELQDSLGTMLELDPKTLRCRLSSQVAADFAASRVDLVGGWVLARTEVRLAALAALVFAT